MEERPEDPTANYQCARVYDLPGREREAIPLSGKDLVEAVLSPGSSHRAVREHVRAAEVLRDGAARFPGNRTMQAFLAMALHNVGEHGRAMELLLRNLAETTVGEDPVGEDLLVYKDAILFYADKLDETW